MSCGCFENTLDFAAVTNNDVLVDMFVAQNSDGDPLDLVGADIIWRLFEPGTRNVLIEKSTAAGTVIVQNSITAPGHFRFQIRPDDSVNFETANYPHEAVITNAEGNTTTVSTGEPEVRYGTAYFRKELTTQ